ncbi:MAG: SCO family protein [Candidatus Eremiobacteraeota bacterium]|nr:SCO family protein [Candidatus Eremiobacteraeota bacterium]MCW5869893.1 SCO family protein [Candidatus Eremiobacteraeota bacterium]
MALWLYLFWCLTSAAWVWLALSPVAQGGPDWLVRTRDLCFGTLENGLPDLHGWITLAAPLPMLLALFALMGRDCRAQLERLTRLWPRPLVLVVLLSLPFSTLSYLSWRVAQAPSLSSSPSSGPLPRDYPELDEACPTPELQDQFGRAFTARQLLGDTTLISFAYAHCQTVCPSLLENLVAVAESGRCRLAIVTLDPRRDTCGSLAGLARWWRLPENSLLLGGEVDQVESALAAFSLTFERNPNTGEILHPALVLVVDARARLRYRFNSPSQAWLRDAVARLEVPHDTP